MPELTEDEQAGLEQLDREIEEEFPEEMAEIRREQGAKAAAEEAEIVVLKMRMENRAAGYLSPEEKEGLPDLEDLEKEASEKKAAQKTLDTPKQEQKGKSEEDLEFEHTLLKRLGFEEYDDRAQGKSLKYKLKLPTSIFGEELHEKYPHKVWIVRGYSDKFPNGKFSAVECDAEGHVIEREGKAAFLPSEDCKKLRPIKQFYQFRTEGYIPPEVVVGKLVSVKGDSRCIEIGEGQGEEPKKLAFPKKLIKKQKSGDYFLPASLTVADTNGEPRLGIPRDLVIPGYAEDEARLLGENDAERSTLASPKRNQNQKPKSKPKTEKKNEETEMEQTTEGDDDDGGDRNEDMTNEIMRGCLCEGIDCVNEILGVAYHLTDVEKADFALRIAQSLFIDEGKNRRAPQRY